MFSFMLSMCKYGLHRSSHAWRNLTFLEWRHGGEKRWKGYIILSCWKYHLGPLTSWWLKSFFLMETWSGLHSPAPRKAVAASLCIFIFILKVPELPRCFGVFELAGELFYFIRSYIQKGFHFEFYHFVWPHQLVCLTECGVFTRNNDLREVACSRKWDCGC